MSFRYLNPGYADLIETGTRETKTSTHYNPFGGVFFSKLSDGASITIPNDMPEIYVKVTLFLHKNTSKYMVMDIFRGTDFQFSVKDNGMWRAWLMNAMVAEGEVSKDFKYEGINEILIYVKQGTAETGHMSVNVNGKVILDIAKAYKQNSNSLTFYTQDYLQTALSNLIVSDAPVGIKEHVIELIPKATETDMAKNDDGVYTANAPGQSLMHTLDIPALIAKYGSETTINSLCFIGSPAYSTGTEMKNVTSILGLNGEERELGQQELGNDPVGRVYLGGGVDMKLSELDDVRIGIKAGV